MFSLKFGTFKEFASIHHHTKSIFVQLHGRYSETKAFPLRCGVRDRFDIKKVTGEDRIVMVAINNQIPIYWMWDVYYLDGDIWQIDGCQGHSPDGSPKDLDDIVEIYRKANGYTKTYKEGLEEIADLALDDYLICALWSSGRSDEEGRPLGNMDDKYSIFDITKAGKARARDMLVDFVDCAGPDDCLEYIEQRSAGHLGHDVWLTQNGCGVGFWDRGLGDLGQRLTEAAGMIGTSYVWEVGNNRHVTIE